MVSAALYVDFDNVFSGLLATDEATAMAFAEHPGDWLDRLSREHPVDGPRRWVVLRCYMNSAGSAKHPQTNHPRVPFAQFRGSISAAGFEIIDCPSLTPQRKNAADIRLAIDVIDALHGSVRYDEFVIASADSDFTPLLMRIRAADRRTTLVSTFDAVAPLRVLADRVIDRQQTQALLRPASQPASAGTVVPIQPVRATLSGPEAEFIDLVNERVRNSDGSVHLALLGKELRAELGSVVDQTKWFAHRTLSRAIHELAPELRIEEQYVKSPGTPTTGRRAQK